MLKLADDPVKTKVVTICGVEARILAYHPNQHRCFIGEHLLNGAWHPFSVDANTEFIVNAPEPPVIVEQWFIVYRDGRGDCWNRRPNKLDIENWEITGIKKVTAPVTPGVFDT